MIAAIFKDGEEINRIVADEAFARSYCAEYGYTYTMEENPEPAPEPEPNTYTSEDLFAALLGLESSGNAEGCLEHLEPQAIRAAALFLADGRVALLRLGVGR